MRPRAETLIILSLVGASMACTESKTRDTGGLDAEPGLDAVRLDTGLLSDSGAYDAGTTLDDGGAKSDGGTAEDAEMELDTGLSDTGPPSDTGLPSDTGVATDTGLATDTGVSTDAAATDSGPDAGSGPVTTIRVHYDTGLGNRITIRGDGSGLSWTSGVDAIWTTGNVWVYSATGWTTPVEYKPLFTREDDSVEWAPGSNYLVAPGATVDIYPFFFSTSGRIVSTSVTSTVYGSRSVEIYLPPSYDEFGASAKHYPVLFMHDGQNLFQGNGPFGGWQLDPSLDLLMTEGKIGSTVVGSIREMIVVAPHNGGASRIYEYTPTNGAYGQCDPQMMICGGGADDYLNFLENDVKPEIDSTYRTLGTRVGIAGSSLGGLLSIYACWTRSASFSECGVLSPSLWWDNEWMISLINNYGGPKLDLRIYLDAGSVSDGAPRAGQLNNILLGQGYTLGSDLFCLIGQGHEHNEIAWRERAPWGLHFLYADPGRAQPAITLPGNLTPCP